MFTSGLTKGWSTAQNFISKGVLRLMKLFDSSLDVEAASKILDENFAAQNAASDQQRNQQIGQSAISGKQAQLAQIEQDRQAAQDEIGQMAADSHAARQQHQDDLQASERSPPESSSGMGSCDRRCGHAAATGPATPTLPTACAVLSWTWEGMDDLLSQIGQDKVSVKGTFNAMSAASAPKAPQNGPPKPQKRRREGTRRSCRKPSMVLAFD